MKSVLKTTAQIGRGDFIVSGNEFFRVIAGPVDSKVAKEVHEYRSIAPSVHAHQDVLHLQSFRGESRQHFFDKTAEFHVVKGPLAYVFWASELAAHKINGLTSKVRCFIYN